MSPSSQKALVNLLLNMFSTSELERLVRYRYGSEIDQQLPRGASPLETADKVVQLLDGRSLLDREFFALLIEERPRRAAEIRAVEATMTAASSGAAPTKQSAEPAASAREASGTLEFVVFTALPLESRAVLKHMGTTTDRQLRTGTVVEIGSLACAAGARQVGLVEVGAGNVAAATVISDALAVLGPRAILFVGVAGGIKDVALGHVVAATKVYGYESGKAGEHGFLPRPEVGQSSYRLVQRARVESRRPGWLARLGTGEEVDVHVAPIAAGEKVVADMRSPTYQFIRDHYSDAVAVEMEGRGFLAAAYVHSVEAMVIRGISDMIEKKNDADALGWQPKAAARAAAFAFEVMANVIL